MFRLELGSNPAEKAPVIFFPALVRRFFFVLVLAFAAGCTSTQSIQEPGRNRYADTDAERVQLIPWAPLRAYEQVGEIIIKPAPSATWQEIDLELRTAAADLGAHAIYVVWDPARRFSSVQVDPLASDAREHYPAKGIAAIAIRLK